jgi:L-alanine-DL-glutamate epimerase-like enolase superfamily enzyme
MPFKFRVNGPTHIWNSWFPGFLSGWMQIEACEEIWPLKETFRISRGASTEVHVVVATVRDGDHIGRGEGVPIKRYSQSCASAIVQIQSIKIEQNLDRRQLQELLPAGAGRNALDCALWDLEAKRSGKRVWELANIPLIDSVETSFTIGLDRPEKMEASAAALIEQAEPERNAREGRSPDHSLRSGSGRFLKLKLGGDEADLARVKAVRAAAPAARLIIDANESWSATHYDKIVPGLKKLGVEFIEQPFPAENDEELAALDHLIPICADESCHTIADLPRLRSRYEMINVKLDKTGGLTEALRLCAQAREVGFGILTGCMVCTSLGIAPARLLASLGDYVDLDGPMLLAADRHHGLSYQHGTIAIPSPELWG